MKLRHIEIFHAVYVTGSVSGAGRALNVSQPTVSKILKHAEDQLGFAVFERVSGRLIPNDKGAKLFAEIEPLFNQLNELSRFTKSLKNTKSGHLRFAMTPAFGLETGPVALTQFAKNNPDITIETETLHSNQIVKALLGDRIDIGLVFDAPSFPGVNAQRIGRTGFVCVAPIALKLPDAHEIKLEALQPHRLITLNEKSVLGQTLNRKLEAAFNEPVQSQIVVETYHLAKRLVKHNAGIALIDGVTAFSGDVTGLQFRKIMPAIDINIDVITRLSEPGMKYHASFLAELKTALDSFCAQSMHTQMAK